MENKFEYSLHQCMWYHMAFWDCNSKGDFLANLTRILKSGHILDEFKNITQDDIQYYLDCKNTCPACEYAYNISKENTGTKVCDWCPLKSPSDNIVEEIEKHESLFIEWYGQEEYVKAKNMLSYMWEERNKESCLRGLFDLYIRLETTLEKYNIEKNRTAKNIVAYLVYKLETYPHIECANVKWKES